jgi:RNA polymerase sigma-70 factor (ECF subfamily)
MNESSPQSMPELDATGALDWGAALATHQGWLRRVIAARLGEPQAVDEVMQEVALAAVAQSAPLQNPPRAAAWLYRLAVRHVLLYRRKTGRARSLVIRYAARKAPNAVDGSASPLAWLLCSERQRLVQEALKRLPPRDAQLLVLKHAEGLSARSIAERLGVAVATIETRLHRARGRLRDELAGLAAEFEANEHETT